MINGAKDRESLMIAILFIAQVCSILLYLWTWNIFTAMKLSNNVSDYKSVFKLYLKMYLFGKYLSELKKILR